MFGRGFFSGAPWGRAALPTASLAGPRKRRGPGLGQLDGCKIPGTELRPRFDLNWNGTGACGNTWMDTSNVSLPDCVQAPPGYPGQPAQGGWIPPSCAQAAPPEPPPSEVPPVEPPSIGVPSCCSPTEGGITCEFPGQGFSDYTNEQLTPEVLAMIESQCAPPEAPPTTPPPPDDYYTTPPPAPPSTTPSVSPPTPGAPVSIKPGPFTRTIPPPQQMKPQQAFFTSCKSPKYQVRNLRTSTIPTRSDAFSEAWRTI